jgi:hypothetical protein
MKILNSYCIPNGADYVNATTYNAFKDAFFGSVYGNKAAGYFRDIANAWPVLAVSVVAAIVVCYLYLFVIRLIGGLIIWLSFLIAFLLFGGGGLYSYFVARPKYELPNPVYNYLTYASYVLWGCAGLVFLSVLCCYNAIAIGIAVFKTTSQSVQNKMKIFRMMKFLKNQEAIIMKSNLIKSEDKRGKKIS